MDVDMDMCICENRECVANDFHIYQKFLEKY